MTVYPVFNPKASVLRLLATVFGFAVLLSACTTTPGPGPQTPGPTKPPVTGTPDPQSPDPKAPEPKDPEPKQVDPSKGLTPPFMAGEEIKRIAILLPFSAKSERLRAEANSMLQAAELSLFARAEDDVLLIALDSAGTPQGAEQATKTALAQGADIILGPILAGSVKASGRAARKSGTPVIAFSTDTSVAGNGVYLLSFPPEAEVKRITQFAVQGGARKFAYLGPDSVYGRRVLGEYRQQVSALGGVINGVETYVGKDITVMQDPAERLARLYKDKYDADVKAGKTMSNPAYHAVLLPEGGTALRSLAPLLPYFADEITPANVQFMGTGLWNRDEAAREPALNGGIFAGPDLEGKLAFNAKFEAVYNEEPSRLASLAYDAVNIAAYVTDGEKQERQARITAPEGFLGVDGLVRFNASGAPERGLAVYQIKNGRFVVIDPAPRSTDGAF